MDVLVLDLGRPVERQSLTSSRSHSRRLPTFEEWVASNKDRIPFN